MTRIHITIGVGIGAMLGVGLAVLAGCSQTQTVASLATPAGQLFCAFNLGGGGTLVAGMIDAAASATAAAPVAVIATNATTATVNADCAAAAHNVAGATSGTPVSPPANATGAPLVAVTPVSNALSASPG